MFIKSAVLLESHSRGIAIIDTAAAAKAAFFQGVLHGQIIRMGINAQAGALLQTPLDARRAYTLLKACRGDPVNHPVGTVIRPAGFGAFLINRFRSGTEDKGTVKRFSLFCHPQAPQSDVFLQQCLLGISISPLGRIARLGHERPGMVIDVQNSGKMLQLGWNDFHEDSPFQDRIEQES